MRWIAAIALLTAAGCAADPQKLAAAHLATGDAYFDKAQFAEAAVEYRVALQAQPSLGVARRKLADSLVKSGNAGAAIGEYIRAADLLPDDLPLQVKAGQMLILAERFEDASARVVPVLAKEPDNLEARLVYANALAGLKDLGKAVAELEEAINRSPGRSEPVTQLAIFRLAQNQPTLAEAEFKRAIEIDPRSVAARLALGNFYLSSERSELGLAQIRAVLDIEPRNELANRTLGAFYLGSGRADDAVPFLTATAEITGARADWLRLADTFIRQHRDADATAVLARIDARGDARVAVSVRRAELALAAGRLDEAKTFVDRALEQDPSSPDALVMRGRLRMTARDRQGAMDSFSDAIRADPDFTEAHFRLGIAAFETRDWTVATMAFGQVLRRNPKLWAAQLYLSRIALARKNAEAAVQAADAALAAGGDQPETRAVLARGLIMTRDFTRAERVIQPLLAAPATTETETIVGTLQLARQDRAAAKKSFDRALALDPANLEAAAGLVTVAIATGQRNEAQAIATRAVDRDPRSASAHMLAARTSLAGGDIARAERSLQRAIELDSASLDAYSLLGGLYVSQSRLDDAQQTFQRMAAQEKKPVSAFTLMGSVLEAQHRTGDAEQAYLQVLQLDPTAPVAANNLAWIYAIQNRNLEGALDLARVAKRGLPDDAHVSDTLGWVLYKKEMYTDAIASLGDSVKLDPDNPGYHLRLGMAHYRFGNYDSARQHLTRALQLRVDVDGAKDAQEILKIIGK